MPDGDVKGGSNAGDGPRSKNWNPGAPEIQKDLTGKGIDGLEEFRHLGHCLGVGRFGAWTEDLAPAVAVLPPESDPVQATRGFAFLEAAALKATSSRRRQCRDHGGLVHRTRR